ncbi:hypothetical protein [Methylobacterium soli]|uniref:Uncharacterized protein n=1 Tax=Methylobacterium soli TaxID=553447 RepID=A0A6L3SXZ0_9HYPH|nr:hypothetical protein [Methylobacterium soli]KAB1078863.1 hypothetical protein F6X53_12680 [Methylobacterium soli]
MTVLRQAASNRASNVQQPIAYPPRQADFGGTRIPRASLSRAFVQRRIVMLKGGLLWLIGIPLPIILLIYFFTNWLH